MNAINKDPMTCVYSPRNELELVMILSVLEGDGISCFVKNNHFGSLKVGPKIELLNGKWMLVKNENSERAKELIDDYLHAIQVGTEKGISDYSAIEKARIVAEFFLFSWFIPGNSYLLRRQHLFVKIFFFIVILLGVTRFFYVIFLWSLTYQ
jgi:Putative prokaryotic signal transducing protein